MMYFSGARQIYRHRNCEILTDTALSLQRHERVGLIVFACFYHLRQALTHNTQAFFYTYNASWRGY